MEDTARTIMTKAFEDAGYRAIQLKKDFTNLLEFMKMSVTTERLLKDPKNVVFSLNQNFIKHYFDLQNTLFDQDHRMGQSRHITHKGDYMICHKDDYYTNTYKPVDEDQLRRIIGKFGRDSSCVICYEPVDITNQGSCCNSCFSIVCYRCTEKVIFSKSTLDKISCPVCRTDKQLEVEIKIQ